MNWISFRVIVSAMLRFRNSGWSEFGPIVGLALGGRLIASWPQSESLMAFALSSRVSCRRKKTSALRVTLAGGVGTGWQ